MILMILKYPESWTSNVATERRGVASRAFWMSVPTGLYDAPRFSPCLSSLALCGFASMCISAGACFGQQPLWSCIGGLGVSCLVCVCVPVPFSPEESEETMDVS